jgi:cell division protein FtsQ
MWDDPRALSRLADALYAVVVAALVVTAALWVSRLPVFAVREVRVMEATAHVSGEQIAEVVRAGVHGNFFAVDLPQLRAALEGLPWVRRVALRRVWPDRIEVAIEEHVPLARWSPQGLVNTHGELFAGAHDGALPLFGGPAGSAKEITIQYHLFSKLLADIGEAPREITISARRAWRVKLAGGMTLDLGRERVEERLERFVAAWPRTIARMGRRVEHADLRYPNGFAVRIPELRNDKDKGGGAPDGTRPAPATGKAPA